MKNSISYIIVFVVLFCSLLFIASRNEEAYKTGSYESSLFADPAGYNVYLPATFQYSFIHDFPENMDHIVAHGFKLDKDKKVITKFTYGVALMQSPFYIFGLGLSKFFKIENTGYSYFNQVLIDVAGISYACLALILLYYTLCRFYSKTVSLFSTLIVFLGTNTFYYASIQPGMSHIYSFFLIILTLHFFLNYLEKSSLKRFVFFSFAFSLVILIRPINIFLVLPILFINVDSVEGFKNRLKQLFNFKNCLVFSVILFLVFIPQFMYWKFAYGNYIADSYPGEGFTYLRHPQIRRFLFSPHNGLIAFSPLYLLLFFTVFLLLRNYKSMAYSYLFTIGLIIYLSSSWYVYFFGCAFGARNFVEFSGLLAFPLASCIKDHFKKYSALILGIVIASCIFVNLKLMYGWDLCFSGKNDWDWSQYNYLLNKPHIELKQNPDSLNPSKIFLINDQKVYRVDSIEEYPPGFEINQKTYTNGYLSSAKISIDVMPIDININAWLCFMIKCKDSVIAFKPYTISGQKDVWKTVSFSMRYNYEAKENYRIQIFIMNKEKQNFYIKNFKAELE